MTKFSKLRLYVMSGTGNSYKAATWMADAAGEAGLETSLTMVERAHEEGIEPAGPGVLTGLVFPTHGFTAPWLMIRFASKMPWGGGMRAFAVSTRAGVKAGPLLLPGISASAHFLIALILFFRGYLVPGVMSLNMPSNWMSLHPGFSVKSAGAINAWSLPFAREFIERLVSGRRVWFTINNLYELLWMILVGWISIAYLLVGRFCLAKIFFANNRCTGCGICAKGCPVGAIRMVGKEKSRPYWRYNCESCMRCMGYCPEKAIEAHQGLAALLTMLITIPFSYYVFLGLTTLIPTAGYLDVPLVRFAVNLFCIYVAIFLSYYPFYALLRLRFFNSLFTWTTFTHLYRRYHEPDTSLKDLLSGTGKVGPKD